MSSLEAQGQITDAGGARKAIETLESVMDRLEQTLSEETARVRAGQLGAAAHLSEAKLEFARLYTMESSRIKAAKDVIVRGLPDAVDRLRKRHDTFENLVRTNLTVLATAHAVSEGIIRGVSGELARKQAPSTYGASGRAQSPSTKASPPLAISRTL
jgi:hypothetical protein